MNWIFLIFSLALLQVHILAEDDVLVLTDDNYESTIKENSFVMVEFYAPWCGHCKAFAPEYEKAAKLAKEQGKPYILAKLDATENKKAAESEQIQGFPTIKFFINGSPISYEGERKADDVLAFLDRKIQPPSTKLESKEDIIKVKEGKGLRCIIGTSSDDIMNVYTTVARTNEDYTCYHTSSSLLKEVFPEANDGNVVLLKDHDEGMAMYTEELKEDKFKDFLASHLIPLVAEMDQKLVQLIFSPGGRTGIFLFRDPAASNAKTLESEFKKVATKLKSNEYAFAHVDIKENWGSRIAEFFAIEESSLPMLEVVQTVEDVVRYKHTGELTEAAMEQFITDCKAGKVTRFYKSEPEPEDNKGPVYKVVGKTFRRDVLDNDDDVFLKFYAPWCGHCKKLEPIYKNLAESLSGNKKLKLMEVDVTKNDIEGHSIEGLPTMKFFPGKDKNNPVTFEGERNEAEMAKFIKEKSSNPVDIPELKSKDEEDLGKEDL